VEALNVTAETLINQAQQALLENRIGDARLLLDELYWESDEAGPDLIRLMAHLEIQDDNLEAAAYWVFELINLAGDDSHLLDEFVQATARRLSPNSARDWLGRIADGRPESPACKGLLRRFRLARRKSRGLLSEAKKLRRAGNFSKARELIVRAGRKAPKDPRFCNELGQIAFEEGDFDAAEEQFHKAHQLEPADPYATNNLGKLRLRQRHYKDAEHWYQVTLKYSPDDCFAMTGLGQVYLVRKQFDKARLWYELVMEQRPGDTAARSGLDRANTGADVLKVVAQAKHLRKRKEYQRAERLLLKAAAQHDNPVAVIVELGLIAHGQRRFDDSRALFVMAYRREPQNLVVLNMLGALELSDRHPSPEQFVRAHEYFHKALCREPSECRTLNNVGWLELRRRNYIAARSYFTAVLKRDANNQKAMRGLGEVAMRRGDYEVAQEWWDRAWWQREGDDPVMLTNLARVSIASGDFTTARTLLETARITAPDDRYVLTSLAYIAICEDRLETAESWLQKAIECDDIDARILNLAAKIAQKRGQFEQSRRYYSASLEIEPGNTYALAGLGWTAYQTGRYEEAIDWFERVLALDSDNPYAHTGLGVTRARQGDHAAAQECYQTSLEKRFHPPAVWHWFRAATQVGNAQQLSWWLKRALESTGIDQWIFSELQGWEKRVRHLIQLTRSGEDPWPYVHQVCAELPPVYNASDSG
jgi:Flp pilus assembly protein TadD